MSTVLATLKDLHGLLVELDDAKKQLQRIPQLLAAKKTDLSKKEVIVAQLSDELKKLKVQSHELEVTLKGGEQRVRDSKGKMNQAKSNKEYQALQEEIKNIESANSKVEEEALEMMSQAEAKASQLADAQKAAAASKAEFAEHEKTSAYSLQKFTDRVTLLETKIKELEGKLDGDFKSMYTRLVKSKGADTLASCTGTTCSVCLMDQTNQMVNNLAVGKLVVCKSCGAILYPA